MAQTKKSNSLLIQDDNYYENKKHLIQNISGSQYDKFKKILFRDYNQYKVEIQDTKSESSLSLLYGMLVEKISIDPKLVNNKLDTQELKKLEATVHQLIESAIYTHFSNILKAFSKDDTIYSLASSVSLKDYAKTVCGDLNNSQYWHFIDKIIELNPDSAVDPEEKVYILEDLLEQMNQIKIENQISVYHFLANLEEYASDKVLEVLKK